MSEIINLIANSPYIEYVGYFASVIVMISFVMPSVLKLRWINLVGSFIFAIYAVFIKSYPTAVLNFAICVLNIYYLIKLSKPDGVFSAYKMHLDNKFLNYFIMFNGKDIKNTFTDFSLENTDADIAVIVYHDLTAAGALIGKQTDDNSIIIYLDYATPQYRDNRVGKYLYRKLKKLGYTNLYIQTENEIHVQYITKMGFVKENDNYVLKLTD